MAPKRGVFPLFLLLSLSALIIFSLYHSSSLPLSPSPPTTLSLLSNLQKPQNPSFRNPPNFTLKLKVLTYDRLSSLSRCLRSLAAAYYDNDKVDIHIFVDHFKILNQSGNESLYLDKKLKESRQILDFVDGFDWRYGEKVVHYRTVNVGLQAQWLEAWWPVSDDEFAFVVEDDIEVSPLYYRFLRSLIVNYYYNASNFSPWIYGATLQRPRFVPGKHGNKIHLDESTRLFLYQLVGTWGQLLFPRPWKEFRLWYDTHKTKGLKPILDGMVTTGWYKKMGDRIWTPWFIKFIHSRAYFNIYTNFLHETALSVSHRDAGVNYGKSAGPDSNLLQEIPRDSSFLDMQPLSKLKWYDFCFRQVLPDRIARNFHELDPVLKSAQKSNTLVLVSLYGTPETLTRNLLCHFERLNIRNYILMAPGDGFLLDLARRGHPVIDIDKVFDSIKAYRSMRVKESRLELMKEMLVKAYVIKKALELKYNTWVLDKNILPLKGDAFLDSFDSTYNFYVGKSSRLFFVRSSSSASKVWTDDFVVEIAQTAESKSSFGLVSAKSLETKGVKLQRVDEADFCVKMDANVGNGVRIGDGSRIGFWSAETGLDAIQKRLEDLGMWVVDGECQCTAVVCHPS